MKHFIYISVLFVIFTFSTYAEDFVDVEVVRVYDGDTFFVNIRELPDVFGKEIGVRVRGIDTPEIRGKCDKEKRIAYKARDYVIEVLNDADTVTLVDVDRGKYFRILATVLVDGVSLTQLLRDAELGVDYDGGKKQSWCE